MSYRLPRLFRVALVLALFALVAAACNGDDVAEPEAPDDDVEEPAAPDDDADEPEAPADIQADIGVDVENQVITIAALNDESGPAASIGVPYAVGKRILVEQVNAGDGGFLPEGWTIELIERDHGYNPAESVSALNEIADQVLFVATSFGTPNTLPLVPILEDNNLVAFPASLSSAMAANEYTPPLGAPYKVEAHQAVDWALEEAGEELAYAVVYQEDDYGQDGLDGAREAAEHHGIEIVTEQSVAPGQADFTATVTALQQAGATHVQLTVLPSATGPILGTAAQMGYTPTWIGATPSWIDRFFNPEVLPPPVYQNFVWTTFTPMWGEDVGPGMTDFLAAYEQYGADEHPPDFYIMLSYLQGVVQLEAVTRAVANGDLTRDGFRAAMREIDDFDAGGLAVEPFDLTQVPYETGTDTRVLRPGEGLEDWQVIRDYSTPDSYAGVR
jgi:ABC-type branched-subunit amino acid transport system substrate-binding protein